MRFYRDGQKPESKACFGGFRFFLAKIASKTGATKNARARNHLREKCASLMWLRAAKLEMHFCARDFSRRVLRFARRVGGRPAAGRQKLKKPKMTSVSISQFT